MAFHKEQEIKKDKDQKYEQINQELHKKEKSLNDLYTQIDEIYESSSTLQEQVDKLTTDLSEEKKKFEQLKIQDVATKLDLTKSEALHQEKDQEIASLKQKVDDF